MDSIVTPAIQRVCLVKSPWSEDLRNLLSVVETDLMLVSPYVMHPGIERVLTRLDERGLLSSVHVSLITDLRPESALRGSLDLGAVATFGRKLTKFDLTHLPSVHAKVYVADDKMAIVTSGNLTEPGLRRNIEYGVALTGRSAVREVRSDFEAYASLGAGVSLEDITTLAADVEELKYLFQRAERSIRSRARRAFEEKLEAARVRVLSQRARGKTTHAIFADTIRYLLGKGPLRTTELNVLVQSLHPDLCDDSVDRVIGTVHFGKKWKHHLRNAQVYLRRRGEIRADGERWQLVRTG